MGAALDRLAGRLEVVREVGGQVMARCPAHEDRTPSLSLRPIEGSVLVHCHGGCATADVLAAVGLGMADLFDDPRGVTYHYDNGRTVHRTPDKRFRQAHTENPPELYRLARVRDAVAEGRPIFLVEGEKDCAAAESAGLTATCCPMGAGKWSKVDPSPLYGGKVLVVADRDEPGRKHAAEIVASLRSHVESVGLFEAAAGKDLADHLAAGYGVEELVPIDLERLTIATTPSGHEVDGAALLDDVHAFLGRFVAYPTEAAQVAHVLWIAHAHLMDAWDSTPRLAFLSPEPGSGKSRALEVTEPLVPRAVHAVNTSPAYLFRKVSDEAGPPTILYDEIDTVFGPKAKDNEDIRGMLNAGHRRGATAGRCVVRGKLVETEELPAYCAVALAGLNDLPDTIMARSVVVRMRPRTSRERVEPWRRRVNLPDALPLHERLAAWADTVRDRVTGAWPTMPAEVQDRDADCWEALLTVADAAGDHWPTDARAAAVDLVAAGRSRSPSLGVLLLADIRAVFTETGRDRLSTTDLLGRLHARPESPWANLRGRELDARALARRLTGYEVSSAQLWIDGSNVRGYEAASFTDAWDRYLDDTVAIGPCRSDPAQAYQITTPEPAVPPEADARNARAARTARAEPESLADLADLAHAEGGRGDHRSTVERIDHRTDQQREDDRRRDIAFGRRSA